MDRRRPGSQRCRRLRRISQLAAPVPGKLGEREHKGAIVDTARLMQKALERQEAATK